MNQPDSNYWLSLAAQWIQSKSQTQMSFPNYHPFSQMMSFPENPPEPPRISDNDATANDNLVEADMEIEDVKDELSQIWSDWQNETTKTSSVNIQSQLPRFPVAAAVTKHHSSRTESRFTSVQIPDAPIISGQTSESSRSSHQAGDSNHVDMVLDSEEEDETSSAIMEAQKRKKLPLWIREVNSTFYRL